MKRTFPLFQSHLDLAHDIWARLIKPGNLIIDATCGTGRDTLFLAQCLKGIGSVISYDIQPDAVQAAKKFLKERLKESEFNSISFHLASHAHFSEAYAHLIIYNLGYLPGGDKSITTRVETTLCSVENALSIIVPGGMVSITCYSGHGEGKRELDILLDRIASLSPHEWSFTHTFWINRKNSPHLLLIQRSMGQESLV